MEPALPVPPIEELDAMFAELVVGGPFPTYSAFFLYHVLYITSQGKARCLYLHACSRSVIHSIEARGSV